MEDGDSLYARIAELERESNYLKALYSYNIGILDYSIAEFQKENEKLKKENEENKAVERFIIENFIDEALRAHYRQGKVIDGEWVNDENSDEDDDEDTDDDEDEEAEEVLENLTCDQLRNRLRAMNQPFSDKTKAKLIKRIRDHEQLKEALFEED